MKYLRRALLQRDGGNSLPETVVDSGQKGVVFAVADDVKILGPSEVIKEMAEGFPTLAWEEAGLTTHTVKNHIYMQSSAQASWSNFIDVTPRNTLTELPVHDIPNGSHLVDPFDPDSERI